MAIDPQLLAYYSRLASRYGAEAVPADPVELRARFAEIAALSDMPDPEGITAEDLVIDLPGRALRSTLFRPAAVALPRLIVYFHGGGWVIGSPRTHRTVAALLAADTGCAVVSVDYRLAPEHPFPAPCDDATGAVQWFAAARERLGLDPAFLAVAGDSAGGHLAAVSANQLGSGMVDAQLLIYPVTAPVLGTESYRAFADGPGLTRDEMAWFWTQFIGPDALALGAANTDPRIALTSAQPGQLPIAPPDSVVLVAAHDVLRDDGLAYADFLVHHGAAVVTIEASGMTHGFARLQRDAPRAREWMRRAAQAFVSLVDET